MLNKIELDGITLTEEELNKIILWEKFKAQMPDLVDKIGLAANKKGSKLTEEEFNKIIEQKIKDDVEYAKKLVVEIKIKPYVLRRLPAIFVLVVGSILIYGIVGWFYPIWLGWIACYLLVLWQTYIRE